MSRIAGVLAALQRQGRTALIPYVPVGDPYADARPEIMHGLVRGGADALAKLTQSVPSVAEVEAEAERVGARPPRAQS